MVASTSLQKKVCSQRYTLALNVGTNGDLKNKTMRILVIGDIHGHDSWKAIVENEKYDKVVFLGDYVDSFTLKPQRIANNLRAIIRFKRENPDKVVLLWGNHDHSYFFGERCSGWSSHGYKLYDPIYDEAFKEGLFDLYYIYDDIIMTHAGVSEYWLKQVAFKDDIKDVTWDDVVPKFGMSGSTILDWNIYAGYDGYGDTISQSPIWIRPNSLIKCPLKGYRQIVGHTNLGKPTFKDGLYINDLMPDYYIIIEDGKIEYVENKFKNYDNNN